MCWWGVSTKHAMLSSHRHHVPCPHEIEYFFSFLFQKYKKCQDKEMFCKVLNMKVTSCCSDSCNSISFISLGHSSQNKSISVFFFSLKICIVSFFSFHLFLSDIPYVFPSAWFSSIFLNFIELIKSRRWVT